MKRFLECLVPVTVCNLKCDYCYVIQKNYRDMEMPDFKYSVEHIAKGLSQERLGGVCYISICGAGETLIPKEVPAVVKAILEEGHWVNVTTNGTQTARFKEIVTWDQKLLGRLHFAFSFHYLELLRLGQLDVFFDNVRRIREAGCSFLVQINLYDGYMPHWDTIKQICEERIGACPQVAVTRNERTPEIRFLTNGSAENYMATGRRFHSPLWEFTLKNFRIRRREFCYAGDWSATLNLCTGEMSGCYGQGIRQNIFEDLSRPIRFSAIGRGCCAPYCFNSSHFLSLGCIPSLATPTYAELRNREYAEWYTPEMKQFLSAKLGNENQEYALWRKCRINLRRGGRRILSRIFHEIKIVISQMHRNDNH